ncbi:hypothetical protein BC792_11334 [Sphingobacterium allocomposti]|uniref:Uncharacterized protein n=1 Tax=Sphingobacterium allocomposti TaxID=415956 RepID=A0A5S5DGA2_9SPHI|nr:hypothetical protein [Sphingobacterium composti Yoo et al. 2007 non Ten et al. 2007]TYP94166.1 hypothetical protein BC792_11334 [Sphingobacterium composti Yoo et al. 2007 non Ten et al. 2007]
MTRKQKVWIFLVSSTLGVSLQLYAYGMGLDSSELAGFALLFGCILSYGSIIYGFAKGIIWASDVYRRAKAARAQAKSYTENKAAEKGVAHSF